MDRREQRRLETQRRLLDAAEQVFSQKGYGEAVVLDITEAANVSKRTFYLHFTDKEAVIEALAMRSFQRLRADVEASETHEKMGGFRHDFERITTIIFQFAQDSPDMTQIVFGRGGSFKLQSMAREFMARAWEENMANKCNCPPDAPVPPALLANAISGVVYQMLCWWFQNPNDFSASQMAAMCTSVLFDGVEVNFAPTLDSQTELSGAATG